MPAYAAHVALHGHRPRTLHIDERPLPRLQARSIEPLGYAPRVRLLRRLRGARKPQSDLQLDRLLPAIQGHDHADRRAHQLPSVPENGHEVDAHVDSGYVSRCFFDHQCNRQDRPVRRLDRRHGILLYGTLPDLDRQED